MKGTSYRSRMYPVRTMETFSTRQPPVEFWVRIRDWQTPNGTGRTKPSLRTHMCPLCLSRLEETARPAGQRCDSCRIWVRKDCVRFGVRW